MSSNKLLASIYKDDFLVELAEDGTVWIMTSASHGAYIDELIRRSPPPKETSRSQSYPVLKQSNPSYHRPQYSSTRSNELVLKGLALCSGCMNFDYQGLSSNRKPKERYEIRYGTMMGCQAFSLTCPLCQILWRDILGITAEETVSREATFVFTPIHSTTIHRGYENNTLIGLWYSTGSKHGHLVFSASPDDPASIEIKRRPPVKNYNDDEAYELARSWLRECSLNHDSCPQDVATLLPTRVVDLGNAFDDPQLLVPKAGSRGRYVALSYCWGASQAVLLTEERLRVSPVVFPLKTLPQTLQDAMVAATRLGFRYIWIDALCIVQDSPNGEDWDRESSNMDKIYGNAAFTIAASAAHSTTEGIFSFPKNQKHSSCSLPYRVSKGEVDTEGTVFVESFDTSNTTVEPLQSRAWALQESLISSRVLHYGTHQMSWRCRTLQENANGPLHLQRLRELAEKWTTTVTEYTRRSLTHRSDRIAALAGYAKLLGSKRLYDEYVAGLWKSGLPEQLLWYRSLSTSAMQRPKPSCGPSWSWASIDCAVNFSYWPDFYQSRCEVLRVSSISETSWQPNKVILDLSGYVKKINTNDFLDADGDIPLRYQSSRQRGSGQPSGEVILDISNPLQEPLALGPTSLVCLHVTPTCGLLLLAAPQSGSVNIICERIGLMTGNIFEEWFKDLTCGPYDDELVRLA